MEKRILHDATGDGIDRRGFLECMAWAGTGLIWTVSGGILGSSSMGKAQAAVADGRLLVRSDQRQPHRLQQGAEQRRDGHVAGGN